MASDMEQNYDVFVTLIVTSLMMVTAKPYADPSECDHVLKLRINENRSICVACKKIFDEATEYGISVHVPAPEGLQILIPKEPE